MLSNTDISLGFITEDKNNEAKLFTRTDEVELHGEDSVIGKSMVLTAEGYYDNN